MGEGYNTGILREAEYLSLDLQKNYNIYYNYVSYNINVSYIINYLFIFYNLYYYRVLNILQ